MPKSGCLQIQPVTIFVQSCEFEAHGILPQAVSPVPAKAIISGVGPGLGQGLDGTMGPAWGWQAPFACVGVCGFSLSLSLGEEWEVWGLREWVGSHQP